ncbi:MAG: L-threonylcarbamoyladenylate synthase [Candidatus Omnitrophica bacterium]|nr:L-threonylcarbamoyladenylate synthase [Candidatus Omnitrophota bacterium]
MRSLRNTLILKVDPIKPDGKLIKYAARVLKDGGLVAFPTETVYGLGVNLLNKEAIARLYKVKERPGRKPLTVHIADVSQIKALGCALDARARKLAKEFWPGPLTMVLRSKKGVPIGFRMPANKVALNPNLSGKKPPTDARAVLAGLDGKIDILLDSGHTEVGVESTVVDMTADPFVMLRQGAIKETRIKRLLANE